MSFKDLNTALSERTFDLCAHLFPNGKREGNRFTIGSVQGEAGKSLQVQLEGPKSGRWRDFAADDGGDLISLIEQARGLSPVQAADFARQFLGMPQWAPDKSAPAAFNPLKFGFKRKDETEWRYPSAAWTYRDAAGEPFAWVARFDRGDGGKDVLPIRIVDGKHRWKGWPVGKEQPPIYGLDRLAKRPDAPVLVVEGEKACDAAARLFPDHVCITWQGGSKRVNNVDWSPLLKRPGKVILWPDADAPGRKAMAYLRTLVVGSHMVATKDLPSGWDLADEAPEDVSVAGLLAAAMVSRAPEQEKEKEEDKDTYKLPKGCELHKVLPDILKYGLFEYGGQVWSVWGDRGFKGKWATDVSNFTCIIKTHIRTPLGAKAFITLNNGSNTPVNVDVDFAMFSTELTFKKGVRDFDNFQWYGKSIDFEQYTRYMMDRMQRGRMITELGGQPDGTFVFCNAMVNGSVTYFDEHGCFEHDGHRNYVPAGNQFYNGEDQFTIQKLLVFRDSSRLTFHEWNKLFRDVHGDNAMPASVFAVAAPFSTFMYKVLRFYPGIKLVGPASAGKDQIIQSAQAFGGDPQPEISLTSPTTDKGLLKMLDEFQDVLMNFTEYKPDINPKMNELLTNIWGRIGYRISALRGKKTEIINIRCPVMVSGNYYFKGRDALITRYLIYHAEKTQHSAEGEALYAKLRGHVADGYSHLMADVMKHRPAFVEQWHEQHYRPARAILQSALGAQRLDARMLGNMQVLLSVYTFFQDKLEWAFTQKELVDYMVSSIIRQQANRAEGNDVSAFWSSFVHAVRTGALIQDNHFKLTPDDRIVFWWEEVYTACAKAHREVFNEKLTDATTLKAALQSHPCWLGPKNSTWIGPKKSSAYAFDMAATGTSLRDLLTIQGKFDAPLLGEEEQAKEALLLFGKN